MNADTPMFRQYSELKVKHPDALLFFRMGDFYELFFDDARLVSEQLGLTLTSRNKDDPNPVPMAGVPHHAAAGYIRELVSRGHKVAVADQVEDPREAKGIVRREITRVITPGLGLDSIRTRMQEIGGTATWDQPAQGGTSVRLGLPVA